jgi:hypothetical protein
MDGCMPVSILIECGLKLSKCDRVEMVDATDFKSLVGSLQYQTSTRPNILYATGFISWHMENLTITHVKVEKRILRYIKGTIDFGLWFSLNKNCKLVGCNESDLTEDRDVQKSASDFIIFIGNTTFTWMSKKQPIVVL